MSDGITITGILQIDLPLKINGILVGAAVLVQIQLEHTFVRPCDGSGVFKYIS